MNGASPKKRPSRPAARRRPAAADPSAVLLSDGMIVDGTGAKAFPGSLLIRDGRIARLGPGPIHWDGVTIDCAGKVLCPGFIDVHSHMDWHLALRGRDELKYPFVEQGVTTVVAGNCGHSAAAFREASLHRDRIEDNVFHAGPSKPAWDTVEEYFTFIASQGLSHNLALLAGHGSTRMSLRGLDPSPLHPYESLELLRLLEAAMDQGAGGVSIGLPYEPGLYAAAEEIDSIARLVRKKNKVLAVRPRTLSAFSAAYPPRRFLGEPHNLVALRELLEVARRTGVRLQISHLAFLGNRTGKTRYRALRMIDEARTQGADVAFDTAAHHCGVFRIDAVLPPWFLARGPEAFRDRRFMTRARRELAHIRRRLGFGSADLRIADAREPDLKRYDGMPLSQIARLRRAAPEQALLELAQKSRGQARVFCRYGDDSILDALIRHPASLFMTDAWVETAGIQNPNAFGAFPRFLRLARESGILTLEETIKKMTGNPAERFRLPERGVLRQGAPADVVVFDPETVSDRETENGRPAAPSGIEYVFLNGRKILSGGRREGPLSGGAVLGIP